ncbi:MAG: PAS domain-containing protein [Dehalococcoidia bacterium]|nr:PAS domain-containing protein [Dehalococcoidia bacterium]MCB9491820.1 PAS domain-containing protein [Dehalococcoidia bacterium]
MTGSRLAGWFFFAVGIAAVIAVFPPALAAAVVAIAVFIGGMLVREPRPPRAEEPAPPPPTATPPAEPEQITALLDLFTEGILLLDAENTVIAANAAAAQVLGRPRDTMIGVSLIRAARDHVFLEVLRESAAEPREIELGEGRVIFATATPVSSGRIRTVLTLQDLTALRRAERARQDLIANVSHELRTPIAAALALSETLESGVDEPEQRDRFARQLTSEIERLGRIVDRLLRLSRIESRMEEFRFEAVNVANLLDEAERRISPVAERRGVSIRREIADGTPTVRADRERVLEVLSNLIDNALRHSPEGGEVVLRARPVEVGVRIDVRDQGPGILPQDRLRIFERFYTGDRSRGDGLGTGLGLAIARHIISRHGGEIWVDDAFPGATLSFTLPAGEVAEATPQAGAPTSAESTESTAAR